MPKSRYAIMSRYMPKVGGARPRHDVPHRDRAGELRFRQRGRHGAQAARLGRAAAAGDGPLRQLALRRRPAPTGNLSDRSAVWQKTDADRSGMLPFAFEDGMGFERYVDYALDVPMYFIKRGDAYIDVAGSSFHDLLAGRHPAVPGERATLSDWANHLSTIFPEVRLKTFLEMPRRRCRRLAVPDRRCRPCSPACSTRRPRSRRRSIWCAPGSAAQREQLRADTPRLGLEAKIAGSKLRDVARARSGAFARGGWRHAVAATKRAPTRRDIWIAWTRWSTDNRRRSV